MPATSGPVSAVPLMFIPFIDDADDMFPLFVLPHAAVRSTTDTTASDFIIFVICKILLERLRKEQRADRFRRPARFASGRMRADPDVVRTPPSPHRILPPRRCQPARRAGEARGQIRDAGLRDYRPRQHV